MSNHETVRELLALSAAGLLEAGEERLVREHARKCAACAAELAEFGSLTAGLGALPVPEPPAGLVARTVVRLAAEADRRQGFAMAGWTAVFACVFVVVVGQTLRLLAGGSAALTWLAWALVSSVLGGTSVLVLLSRRRPERSIP